jgi:hypothetical protein
MKVSPMTSVMTSNPIGLLDEDEDQGEMDTVFFLSTAIYTAYILCIDLLYDEENVTNVNKFHVIMSNLFAFFPLMQAQGLWLKFLIFSTCYFSIVWHWTADLKLGLPGSFVSYERGDLVFSIMTIISYCLSWLPKVKPTIPSYKQELGVFGWWYKNCRGQARETSEWRCRLSVNLAINFCITSLFGAVLYIAYDQKAQLDLLLCWFFITIAVVSALYQLYRGNIRVKKYRTKFCFWVIVGVVFGSVSFIHKLKEDLNAHIMWHVYVFACAYSFSRASEYIDIYHI